MIDFVQGPVRPLVQQGSSVTYRVAPLAFSPAFFSATISACSRRSYAWNPSPIARPLFTRTAPTTGFGCASATPRCAKSKARFRNAWCNAARELVEERVDIGLRVEGDEVVDFFAGADKADGEVQFAGDGDNDAAFGGAVELGKHDTGNARVPPKLAGLVETILAGGRVENQENVMRRAGNNFRRGALHFFQLGHEI